MSMAICQDCGTLVDTDDDPECFVPVANHDIVVCEGCRWLRAEAEDRWQDGPQAYGDQQKVGA